MDYLMIKMLSLLSRIKDEIKYSIIVTITKKPLSLAFKIIPIKFYFLIIEIYSRLFYGNNEAFDQANISIVTNLAVTKKKILKSRVIRNTIPYLLNSENKELIDNIKDCAEILKVKMSNVDNDVVLMPLHFVSDVSAMVVGTLACKKKNLVFIISDQSRDVMLNSKAFELNLKDKISFHRIDVIDSSFIAKMLEARKENYTITIFPDITPEFTLRALAKNKQLAPQQFHKQDIFEKTGQFHSGPIKIAKLLNKKVIPYYLYEEDNQIKIKISEPVENHDLQHKLAYFLEDAIRKYPEQWMLWRYSSFFYYSI